jgi:hypothetical protein
MNLNSSAYDCAGKHIKFFTYLIVVPGLIIHTIVIKPIITSANLCVHCVSAVRRMPNLF